MKFYSGFSLKNEECYFESFINTSNYTVCGFSYGAIRAFEDVCECLACSKRVDTLQLFSPAFFQNKSESFKKVQLRSFAKNSTNYLNTFINSCFSPHAMLDIQRVDCSLDELEELLYYNWSISKLQDICDKGVKIEVYLGSKDEIVDAQSARDFFKEVATVTYIKNANHFLQIK
jgi:hypothetical protein